MSSRNAFPGPLDPAALNGATPNGAAQRWSFRLALLLCGGTVVLLGAGALVTSTGSGLAVPDWPLAYGQWFPPMVGGILYEHGHRLIAATVGILSIVLCAWLWWAESRRWVWRLSLAALAVVVLQGVLGGMTVLLLLPKSISISHALLAQVFFLLTVLLAQVTAPGWRELVSGAPGPGAGRALIWSASTLAMLFVELVLGALVRHHGAGLAIPDFPLAYGRLIPPLTAFPIVIHFLHRLGAVAVLVLVAGTVWQVLRHHGERGALARPAVTLAALAVVQVVLGAGIIWSLRAPLVTTAHLVTGALMLAAAGLLTLRCVLVAAAGGLDFVPRPVEARPS